jgi:hypothetical protein
VKGAGTGIFPAGRAVELHAPADQIDEINPAAQFIKEALRKDHVLSPLSEHQRVRTGW